MDGIDWDQALAQLDALRLPPVVRTAFAEPSAVPGVLQWLMRAPVEMFEEPMDPGFYPEGAIIPLWADHTGHIVVGHRRGGVRPGFLRFLLEEPELIEEGLSFESLIVRDLVSIWERERDDERAEHALREAARHLAFTATDRLVDALCMTRRQTSAAHDAFLAAFRATLI